MKTIIEPQKEIPVIDEADVCIVGAGIAVKDACTVDGIDAKKLRRCLVEGGSIIL